jgi:hypothetical protein
MKKYLFILPFIYSPLCIMLPIWHFDARYYNSTLFLFWYPTMIMLAANWKWMSDKRLWRPFLQVNGYLAIFSVYFEYASLGLSIWGFNQSHHKLLDIPTLMGAPIEEFMFYFGATPFCLLLYFTFYRIIKSDAFPFFKRRAKGVEVALLTKFTWMGMSILFLPVMRFIHNLVRKSDVVNWPSIWMALSVFWASLAFMEAHSVQCGHWVYNPDRVLHIIKHGPFRMVAIEEFFQYYVLAPIFVALFFHLLELRPSVVVGDSRLWDKLPKATRQAALVEG